MRENFAIINFFGGKCRASAIRADFSDKKLELSESFDFPADNCFSALENFFSFVFYPRAYSAVFIFPPDEAAGFCGTVSAVRSEPGK